MRKGGIYTVIRISKLPTCKINEEKKTEGLTIIIQVMELIISAVYITVVNTAAMAVASAASSTEDGLAAQEWRYRTIMGFFSLALFNITYHSRTHTRVCVHLCTSAPCYSCALYACRFA